MFLNHYIIWTLSVGNNSITAYTLQNVSVTCSTLQNEHRKIDLIQQKTFERLLIRTINTTSVIHRAWKFRQNGKKHTSKHSQ